MKKLMHHLLWLVKGVQVYALVGKSGTGKSFRAKLVAQKNGIDLIIDDGLLIQNQKIVAGKTAKKAKGYLEAVRTAIFDDPEHRKDVIKYLEKTKFKSILLLGTSEKMVTRIASVLDLPKIIRIIKIEEVADREEIEKAIHSRTQEGKHVIPVPSIEVKRNYPQIFYDEVRVFLNRKFGWFKKKDKMFEKSIVQPEFDRKGSITISEAALSQMIIHCIDEYDAGIQIQKIKVRTDNYYYRIFLSLAIPYGIQLTGNLHDLQNYIRDNIEKYTGIYIDELDISIDSVRSSK